MPWCQHGVPRPADTRDGGGSLTEGDRATGRPAEPPTPWPGPVCRRRAPLRRQTPIPARATPSHAPLLAPATMVCSPRPRESPPVSGTQWHTPAGPPGVETQPLHGPDTCPDTCPSSRPKHGAEFWELEPTTVQGWFRGPGRAASPAARPHAQGRDQGAARSGRSSAAAPGRTAGAAGELTSTVAAAGGAPGRGRPSGRGGVSVAPVLLQEL